MSLWSWTSVTHSPAAKAVGAPPKNCQIQNFCSNYFICHRKYSNPIREKHFEESKARALLLYQGCAKPLKIYETKSERNRDPTIFLNDTRTPKNFRNEIETKLRPKFFSERNRDFKKIFETKSKRNTGPNFFGNETEVSMFFEKNRNETEIPEIFRNQTLV